SHSGYMTGTTKSAVASGLRATSFELVRVSDRALGAVVLSKPVQTARSRLGDFKVMDFSEVNEPGRYVIRAGDVTTLSFTIGDDAWPELILATFNFLYGNRCGYLVPGSHGLDHLDWFATHGD